MYHIVKRGETLAVIAANYRRPLSQILSANPGIINPALIYPGQRISIPGLPDPASIPYSISVSLTSKRLSLYRAGKLVKTYPVGIGKMLTQTPVGEFVIVNREPNPGGPYGVMWLSLSKLGYGIHGTNNPASIGKSVSKGCIRMQNKDVLELARQVPNGTRVAIRP
ncbi:L,D-transpeptidase family protein [Bacillus sp. ISL-35]|uniref:L,D-transpeptidase family protein n=1 Tax=Bacillus sp. ISL-35 TaxID=2819122 RepID=UPI001BE63D1E|nr:L,D-transpeptidase family protein [Bacillus sp. ISL-35]MBT2678378.1 L,D-transpeptidase family protein [Bacillus sp. ISL-35]MBT2705898.1 L,D-transpeptidase family protein [Chryseobacterium sp. ISL-80]